MRSHWYENDFFTLIQMKFVFFLLGFLTSLGNRVLRLGRSLGRCCVQLHYGTVLGDAV